MNRFNPAGNAANPFTQRQRITRPERFVGRWRELSVIFDRLEAGRPVLIGGVAGIGISSLLTHLVQAAAVNLERPDLVALYADLAVLEDETALYELVNRALGRRGDSLATLELTITQWSGPVLLCLDGVQAAVAAGWGGPLLENLARVVRRSVALPAAVPPLPATSSSVDLKRKPGVGGSFALEPGLLLVAGCRGVPPVLSEPFATLVLGAFSQSEVRLLTESYLDYTGVQFSADDLRDLAALTLGHPAYLQRAAYHLYIRRSGNSADDWEAAYLAEAAERPIPGAPLPPAIFEGDRTASLSASVFNSPDPLYRRAIHKPEIAAPDALLLLPLAGGVLVWVVAGSLLAGGAVFLGLLLLVWRRAA